MTTAVVVGAQWGDEGKGKVVDIFAADADVVARYCGGANAGHTLVTNGEKLVTHLIPSGVLHPETICVLGAGMVIDPDTLNEEVERCKSLGLLKNESSLAISERAHVIFPYHKRLEQLREASVNAIGTTKRGIGPAYEAKAARHGVRMGDLRDVNRAADIAWKTVSEINLILAGFAMELITREEVYGQVKAAATAIEELLPKITNVGRLVSGAQKEGKAVLLEGAQGALLDVDHGTYPYVTSSATTAAGACQGIGVGPTTIDKVVGITKAYCTRVGAGPFPTELDDEAGEALRQAGNEFGATTGRPRRCGWLDLPALRTAIRVNGIDQLAVTKLDVLGGLQEVSVCTHYELDGETLTELPAAVHDLERVTPIWRQFPGWPSFDQGAQSMGELPPSAQEYLATIQGELQIPLCLVSIGPDRNQTIVLDSVF